MVVATDTAAMVRLLRVKCRVLWVSLAMLLTQICARRQPHLESAQGGPVDPVVSCALNVVRSQLADSSHIIVLGHAAWLGGFLGAVRVPVTLLEMQEDRVPVHNKLDDVFFLLTDGHGSSRFVQDGLNKLRRLQVFYARVVVWWRSGDAQAVMQLARSLEIIRLVLVSGSGEDLEVFRYDEVCVDGRTSSGRAVLAVKCGEEDLFDGNLFLDLLQWDLKGCPLRFGVLENAPIISLSYSPEGVSRFKGSLTPVALALVREANVTPDLIASPHSNGGVYPNGTAWGSFRDLLNKRFDVLIGFIIFTKERLGLFDYSESVSTSSSVIFVPSGLGPETNILDMLYREFTLDVWVLVVLAYFFSVILFSVSLRSLSVHNMQDAAFSTLSSLLGNSVLIPLETVWVRILTSCWLMFCIVMCTAYQAQRQSLVAAPTRAPEMDTLAQVVEYGMKMLGFPTSIEQMRLVAEEEGNGTLLALTEHFELINNLISSFNQMITTKESAIFADRLITQGMVGKFEKDVGHKVAHIIPGYSTTNVPTTTFALRRGSPFTPLFNKVVNQFLVNGYLQYALGDKLKSQFIEEKQGWSQFGLGKLGAVFLVLFTGLAASSIVFIVEVSVRFMRVKVIGNV